MKILKKNAVVLAVMVFVCAAVYLNWSFGKKQENDKNTGNVDNGNDTATTQVIAVSQKADPNAAGLFFTEDTDVLSEASKLVTTDYSDYFASVRLARSQARDEATETLQVACATTEASEEFINTAATQILDIAQWTMQEADIENLIMARGFEDCVVYMTENGVSVTVPAPMDGLSDAAVAKITDVILSETGYTADMLRIVEIK